MVTIDDKISNKITNLPVQQDIRKSPTNLEAERSLLGAILSNNKAFEQVESFLNENDFAETS